MKIGKDFITIRRLDDWHAHLRDDGLMQNVISLFDIYGRVVCMGNLEDPVDDLQKVINYHNAITRLTGGFLPIIGVILTKNFTVEKLIAINQTFFNRVFLKYLPEGVTNNSEHGITWRWLNNYYPVLEAATELNIPFLVHAENIFDYYTSEPVSDANRERAAVPYVDKLASRFPGLKITVEHVSTAAMVNLVKRHDNLSASISPNHLIHGYEDAMDETGRILNPHIFFRPIAPKKHDRKAVTAAALSGNPKFFFGSDCAPHRREDKEHRQKAGAFNALTNLAILVELFEKYSALDQRLEDFVANNGAARYGYPLNTGTVTLRRQEWQVPDEYHGIVPDLAGRVMKWQIVS